MSLYTIITQIVKQVEEKGYQSDAQVANWMRLIRDEAVRAMLPETQMKALLASSLQSIYGRMIDDHQILKHHKGVERFTLQMVKPQLRKELERRINASANLIKLNREEAITKTLRRFSGWVTSIPDGGELISDKNDIKVGVVKAIKSLPFEERRVLIDQGHKLTAELNNIIATSGGAIALIWHSHYQEMNYNYRKSHKARDGKYYVIRGNWALDKGLMKLGGADYYDTITSVGQEPFCRCYAQYIYNLRDLPLEMITKAGHESLAAARRVL